MAHKRFFRHMRYESKRIIVYGMCLLIWPFGLLSVLAYKLFSNEVVFDFSAKLLSLIPGKVGQYLRAAFYKMTLTECHCDLLVGFCSFFLHPTVRAGRRVGMGSFTTVDSVDIGDNVMISSHVSILRGKNQYASAQHGVASLGESQYEPVTIGAGCWIGERAIVMASLGRQCMVSAGSVVTKQAPDHTVAVGNPARFLKSTGGSQDALS